VANVGTSERPWSNDAYETNRPHSRCGQGQRLCRRRPRSGSDSRFRWSTNCF